MEMLKALRKGASAVDALTYLFATLSGLYVGLLGLLLAKLYEQAALVYRYFFPKRGEDGVKLIIKEATSVPRMDILSESDTYVHVSTVVGGRVMFNTTTPVVPSNVNPQWDCTVFLGDHLWEGSKRPPKDVMVHFEMRDADHVGSDFIGLATVTLEELQKKREHLLLMQTPDGDPVLRWDNKPPTPCELRVGVDLISAVGRGRGRGSVLADQKGSMMAKLAAKKTYPRHVFMMSRGTRGDVQPFVALARGMAAKEGWLVTICTELAWKDFVEGKAADGCGEGKVQFLPSGGDTALQTSGWVAQQAMSSKTEFMQTLMMAASEANFFASAPVLAAMIERAQQTEQKIDLLVPAFTLQGVGLLLSERYKIPCVGFCLQPTCLPSRHPEWQNVIPIESHGLGLVDKLEERLFTSHSTLQTMKTAFESNPLSKLSLPRLRDAFGLKPSNTWRAVYSQDIPIVIPMKPGTFAKPDDWNPQTQLTDFIFLRSSAPGGGELSAELSSFCKKARSAGRKLVLMTFSSMPVPRATMLKSAVKMASEAKAGVSLIYVGPPQPDVPPKALVKKADSLKSQGKLLEVARADFGVLFREMDAFVVHGGLGSTVEAMRMRKPVAVTGILLMDQRFWGGVCHEMGIGPPPVHIDDFHKTCVQFVDKALDDESEWARKAKELDMGDEADDGVEANVTHFKKLLDSGKLRPAKADAGKL